MMTGKTIVGLLLGACALPLCVGAAPAPDGVAFFESRIRPVLVDHCYKCHSAQAHKSKGGLRLDAAATVRKGGDSGPPIVAGQPDQSLLIQAIRYRNDDLQMPPKEKLPDAVIHDFEQWVRLGAPYPELADAPGTPDPARQHWAFVCPTHHAPPPVKDTAWVTSPIDAFVLARLEAAGLHPNPPADKRTLIRRATFDLIGLPPTVQEVDAFLADHSADAFAKVVDRLLASPHHGERWGRHWLDVARYADSKGYVFQEERRYPYAYTYRDWVIRALNDDLAYNQFIIQQIAADRLDLKGDTRPLAAMGFLTVGRRFLNNPADIIDDRLDVVFRGTMGMTIGCARCHDHKFDPIPTRDYYSLYGVFASSTEPSELPLILPAEHNAQTEAFERELGAKRAGIDAFLKKRHGEILALIRKPEQVKAHLAAAREVVDKKANPHTLSHDRNLRQPVIERMVGAIRREPAVSDQQWLERWTGAGATNAADSPFAIPLAQVESLFLRDDREKLAGLRQAIDALQVSHPGAPARAMVLHDLPKPVEPVVFKRGNAKNPGPQVPRQFLAILSGPDRKPFQHGSGRLEMARDIASRDNPLTARVIVNRVWGWHFGQALVRTPSDFGTRGQLPTHPQLLDDLSVWFMDNGWSLKKLHRRIMLSATYQQSSMLNPVAFEADPENRLIWRMNLQRLDFEETRDALLAASGRLDLAMFGRPVDIGDVNARRRTIYGFIDRQNLPGMFRAFDFASPDTHSPGRFTTTVPQQALFLMNGGFAIAQAKALAARADVAGVADPASRVQAIYRAVFARPATRDEVEVGCAYVQQEQTLDPGGLSPWVKYAQALLETNEFAFVD